MRYNRVTNVLRHAKAAYTQSRTVTAERRYEVRMLCRPRRSRFKKEIAISSEGGNIRSFRNSLIVASAVMRRCCRARVRAAWGWFSCCCALYVGARQVSVSYI